MGSWDNKTWNQAMDVLEAIGAAAARRWSTRSSTSACTCACTRPRCSYADDSLSELWKDVFLFHWKEESQHAVLDELEWRREDARLTGAERDRGVDELIELVGAVDGICQMQAQADADFFLSTLRRPFGPAEAAAVHAVVLKAYRWQYIVSGAQEPRFQQVLKALVTPAQMQRILHALAPFFADA